MSCSHNGVCQQVLEARGKSHWEGRDKRSRCADALKCFEHMKELGEHDHNAKNVFTTPMALFSAP